MVPCVMGNFGFDDPESLARNALMNTSPDPSERGGAFVFVLAAIAGIAVVLLIKFWVDFVT